MTELFIKKTAALFRRLPHFRGKYRIGTTLARLLISKWQEPQFFVTLKDGTVFFIDVRSQTHLAPFWCGTYDSEILHKFSRLLQPENIVLDIGANIGYYSVILAKQLAKIDGKLLAFEPVTANYNVLVQNIKANDLEKTVTTYKIGLGATEETLEIVMTEDGETGNAVILNDVLKNERRFSNIERIPIQKMDVFAEQNNITRCDFIKIDIEGAEIFFSRGAKQFLSKTQPIIYAEFNLYFIQKFGLDIQEAYTFFETLNYSIYYQVRENGRLSSRFSPLTEEVKPKDNLLLLPARLTKKEIEHWIN
jgi:FkbM family methyltransferase